MIAFLHELDGLKRRHPAGVARRPFVTASFAISADGCLSQTRGSASRISGPESLRMTHQLRAMHDALLVGVGTVLTDDPQLNTRLVSGPSPLRVVLDTTLRVPISARLLCSTPQPPWLVTTENPASARARALAGAGADLIRVPESTEGVSLSALLERLSARGVTSLMLEGGAATLESFFRQGYVDYLALTVSPESLGNPCAVELGGTTAAALRTWRATHHARVGRDHVAAGVLHAPARAQPVA
jgi:GTP cyclohydrolase II